MAGQCVTDAVSSHSVERAATVNTTQPLIKMHMKLNGWTLGLVGAGLVSLPAVTQAEEKPSDVMTALSATTLSGYVDTSASWRPGNGTAAIPGRAFDAPASKQDGFNLDVLSLTLSKPVSEGEWGAGYTAQIWAGPDAVGFNTSFFNTSGSGGDF